MDLEQLISDIREMVECESPSADLAAVARSADVVARVGTRRLGVEPERIVLDGRTHLRWRLGTGPSRVLVLGHHDTVWPLGSLATRPCAVDGGVLRGPGCFDMKAGLAMAFHAARRARRPRRRHPARHRRRGARLAQLPRADRGRGPRRARRRWCSRPRPTVVR